MPRENKWFNWLITYGWHVIGAKRVVRIATHDARFADARVADQQYFKQMIIRLVSHCC